MKKKKLFAGVCSGLDSSKNINPDSILFNGSVPDSGVVRTSRKGEFDGGIFAVASGTGGAALTSQTVVNSLLRFANGENTGYEDIKKALNLSDSVISKKITETGEYIESQASIAVICKNRIDVYNKNGGNCFLFRDGRLTALCINDPFVPYKTGADPTADAFSENSEPAAFKRESFTLKKGDVIILCTNGLTQSLSENEISRVAASTRNYTILATGLVRQAMKNGAANGATALIVKVLRGGNFFKTLLYILPYFLSTALGVLTALILLTII